MQLPLDEECLNEVRPRRPEQSAKNSPFRPSNCTVSMKSGLEGRNNDRLDAHLWSKQHVSMKSGLEGRNNRAWT